MKILSSILIFYILFLVFEPSLQAILLNEVKIECCGGSCNPGLDGKSHTEIPPIQKGLSGCNPFEMCNGCSGYIFVLSFISSKPETFHIERYKPVTENLPSEIALDFWHPPKIG